MQNNVNNKALSDEHWDKVFSDFGLKPFDQQEIEYVRSQAKQAYEQYEKFVRQLNVMLATNKQIKLDEQKPITNQLTIEQ